MWKRTSWIVVVAGLVLLWPYQPVAIGKKPFSVDDLVAFLQRVSPQKVAEEVGKQGVNFDWNEEARKKLKNAGADDALLIAVERESLAYTREKWRQEQQEIELRRKKEAEEKAKREQDAIKAQQKAEEDAKRKEDARLQAEAHERQRTTAAAERKAKEDADRQETERKRAEEETRKKAEEERNRTGEMVSVPAGAFFMGCNEEVDSECDDDEKPGRQVNVDVFKIDKTEVTVAQYAQCVNKGKCSSLGLTMPYYNDKEQPEFAWACNWRKDGRENHPINCLDWNQARAYCGWAGKRLLTEAEWEKAARGTDRRKYPWGNRGYGNAGQVANIADETAKRSQPNWATAVGYDDRFYGTAPVGSFPVGASPYEALDMIGNVWEWTADWYDKEQKYRSVRGGAWNNLPQHARASARYRFEPGRRTVSVSMRCAQ
jgi:formylglycine-generating enzyme required for sulfatase activity